MSFKAAVGRLLPEGPAEVAHAGAAAFRTAVFSPCRAAPHVWTPHPRSCVSLAPHDCVDEGGARETARPRRTSPLSESRIFSCYVEACMEGCLRE